MFHVDGHSFYETRCAIAHRLLVPFTAALVRDTYSMSLLHNDRRLGFRIDQVCAAAKALYGFLGDVRRSWGDDVDTTVV